jgi:hypothetical protein
MVISKVNIFEVMARLFESSAAAGGSIIARGVSHEPSCGSPLREVWWHPGGPAADPWHPP